MEAMITSKDNPVVRHYRKLCENKRWRRSSRQFPAEGLRLVRESVQAGMCETVLLTAQAAEKYAGEFPGALVLSDELGRRMADTEHPQGVFAVCRMPDTALTPQRLDPQGRYLVLYELQDPGNMGMIQRTADALGIDGVIVCRSCDIYSPKTVRATMGAVFRLPVWEAQDAAGLAGMLQAAGVRSFAAVLHRDARLLTDGLLGKGCAVWIGNEGSGLAGEAVEVCQEKVMIPMTGHAESLNAAMAAGILMWEMMK